MIHLSLSISCSSQVIEEELCGKRPVMVLWGDRFPEDYDEAARSLREHEGFGVWCSVGTVLRAWRLAQAVRDPAVTVDDMRVELAQVLFDLARCEAKEKGKDFDDFFLLDSVKGPRGKPVLFIESPNHKIKNACSAVRRQDTQAVPAVSAAADRCMRIHMYRVMNVCI